MFRPTLQRLTTDIRTAPTPASRIAAQLLQPIPLYRRLLRVHRKVLPIEMRVMGDGYVKDEFRRTRSTENPLYIVGFLKEWKTYLDFHESQLAATGVEGAESAGEQQKREGQKLQMELFEKLSAEQIGQLYELLQATREVWTDPSAAESKSPEQEGIPKGEVLPSLEDALNLSKSK